MLKTLTLDDIKYDSVGRILQIDGAPFLVTEFSFNYRGAETQLTLKAVAIPSTPAIAPERDEIHEIIGYDS
jgi:hypothetical protein